MLTIDIKRSVAALAVTAGLLAAAAPASHGATQTGPAGVKAPVTVSSFSWGMSQTPSGVKAKSAKGKHAKGSAKARYQFYDLVISS
jgi:hypothetical protein